MIRTLLAAVAMLQDPATARLGATPDSTAVLDFATFEAQVRRRHPVARQAELLEARARAEVLAAKAPLWDPVLGAEWSRKALDSDEYYNYLEAGLTLPTPIGLEFTLEVRDPFPRF